MSDGPLPLSTDVFLEQTRANMSTDGRLSAVSPASTAAGSSGGATRTAVSTPSQRRRAPTVYSKVTPTSRANEYPGTFRPDGQQLFCKFCNVAISWGKASSVRDHIKSKSHKRNKDEYDRTSNRTVMQTLQSMQTASEVNKGITQDLVRALIEADIPLEKMNCEGLRNFFKKHCRGGGTIPRAATLRESYVIPLYEAHLDDLKSFFAAKRISILMDETTDDCARHVVNVIFKYRDTLKLVAMEFADKVDNISMGQVVAGVVNRFVKKCLLLTIRLTNNSL